MFEQFLWSGFYHGCIVVVNIIQFQIPPENQAGVNFLNGFSYSAQIDKKWGWHRANSCEILRIFLNFLEFTRIYQNLLNCFLLEIEITWNYLKILEINWNYLNSRFFRETLTDYLNRPRDERMDRWTDKASYTVALPKYKWQWICNKIVSYTSL